MEEGDLTGARVYQPNDIVWVKLFCVWWPAEVQDQATLDPQVTRRLKKPPLAVVKYLPDGTYGFIRSHQKICPYNCERKPEFLKLGFKKYSRMKNEKTMSLYPAVILEAERLTNGDLNILENPEFLQYLSPCSTVKELSRVGSRHDLSSQPSSSKTVAKSRQSTAAPRSSATSVDEQTRQTLRAMAPPPIKKPKPDEKLQCAHCAYSTQNVGHFIVHQQLEHPSSVAKPQVGFPLVRLVRLNGITEHQQVPTTPTPHTNNTLVTVKEDLGRGQDKKTLEFVRNESKMVSNSDGPAPRLTARSGSERTWQITQATAHQIKEPDEETACARCAHVALKFAYYMDDVKRWQPSLIGVRAAKHNNSKWSWSLANNIQPAKKEEKRGTPKLVKKTHEFVENKSALDSHSSIDLTALQVPAPTLSGSMSSAQIRKVLWTKAPPQVKIPDAESTVSPPKAVSCYSVSSQPSSSESVVNSLKSAPATTRSVVKGTSQNLWAMAPHLNKKTDKKIQCGRCTYSTPNFGLFMIHQDYAHARGGSAADQETGKRPHWSANQIQPAKKKKNQETPKLIHESQKSSPLKHNAVPVGFPSVHLVRLSGTTEQVKVVTSDNTTKITGEEMCIGQDQLLEKSRKSVQNESGLDSNIDEKSTTLEGVPLTASEPVDFSEELLCTASMPAVLPLGEDLCQEQGKLLDNSHEVVQNESELDSKVDVKTTALQVASPTATKLIDSKGDFWGIVSMTVDPKHGENDSTNTAEITSKGLCNGQDKVFTNPDELARNASGLDCNIEVKSNALRVPTPTDIRYVDSLGELWGVAPMPLVLTYGEENLSHTTGIAREDPCKEQDQLFKTLNEFIQIEGGPNRNIDVKSTALQVVQPNAGKLVESSEGLWGTSSMPVVLSKDADNWTCTTNMGEADSCEEQGKLHEKSYESVQNASGLDSNLIVKSTKLEVASPTAIQLVDSTGAFWDTSTMPVVLSMDADNWTCTTNIGEADSCEEQGKLHEKSYESVQNASGLDSNLIVKSTKLELASPTAIQLVDCTGAFWDTSTMPVVLSMDADNWTCTTEIGKAGSCKEQGKLHDKSHEAVQNESGLDSNLIVKSTKLEVASPTAIQLVDSTGVFWDTSTMPVDPKHGANNSTNTAEITSKGLSNGQDKVFTNPDELARNVSDLDGNIEVKSNALQVPTPTDTRYVDSLGELWGVAPMPLVLTYGEENLSHTTKIAGEDPCKEQDQLFKTLNEFIQIEGGPNSNIDVTSTALQVVQPNAGKLVESLEGLWGTSSMPVVLSMDADNLTCTTNIGEADSCEEQGKLHEKSYESIQNASGLNSNLIVKSTRLEVASPTAIQLVDSAGVFWDTSFMPVDPKHGENNSTYTAEITSKGLCNGQDKVFTNPDALARDVSGLNGNIEVESNALQVPTPSDTRFVDSSGELGGVATMPLVLTYGEENSSHTTKIAGEDPCKEQDQLFKTLNEFIQIEGGPNSNKSTALQGVQPNAGKLVESLEGLWGTSSMPVVLSMDADNLTCTTNIGEADLCKEQGKLHEKSYESVQNASRLDSNLIVKSTKLEVAPPTAIKLIDSKGVFWGIVSMPMDCNHGENNSTYTAEITSGGLCNRDDKRLTNPDELARNASGLDCNIEVKSNAHRVPTPTDIRYVDSLGELWGVAPMPLVLTYGEENLSHTTKIAREDPCRELDQLLKKPNEFVLDSDIGVKSTALQVVQPTPSKLVDSLGGLWGTSPMPNVLTLDDDHLAYTTNIASEDLCKGQDQMLKTPHESTAPLFNSSEELWGKSSVLVVLPDVQDDVMYTTKTAKEEFSKEQDTLVRGAHGFLQNVYELDSNMHVKSSGAQVPLPTSSELVGTSEEPWSTSSMFIKLLDAGVDSMYTTKMTGEELCKGQDSLPEKTHVLVQNESVLDSNSDVKSTAPQVALPFSSKLVDSLEEFWSTSSMLIQLSDVEEDLMCTTKTAVEQLCKNQDELPKKPHVFVQNECGLDSNIDLKSTPHQGIHPSACQLVDSSEGLWETSSVLLELSDVEDELNTTETATDELCQTQDELFKKTNELVQYESGMVSSSVDRCTAITQVAPTAASRLVGSSERLWDIASMPVVLSQDDGNLTPLKEHTSVVPPVAEPKPLEIKEYHCGVLWSIKINLIDDDSPDSAQGQHLPSHSCKGPPPRRISKLSGRKVKIDGIPEVRRITSSDLIPSASQLEQGERVTSCEETVMWNPTTLKFSRVFNKPPDAVKHPGDTTEDSIP